MIKTLQKIDFIFLLVLAGLLAVSLITHFQQAVFSASSSVPNTLFSTNTLIAEKLQATSASDILPITEEHPTSQVSTLPDFAAYQDVQTKKQKFFKYLIPKVRHANDKIRADRSLLLIIREDLVTGGTLDADDLVFISRLQKRYRIRSEENPVIVVRKLLSRVDIVPASLVLAQAANESGWGTSRFAREANNLFGVWCFSPGCGLTPKSRDAGLIHEVASYPSVQKSVEAYIRTINTHAAYQQLREIRAGSRRQADQFNGLALAEGLLKYSARGLDYVREIQQLIRVNDLHRYTLPLQA
jgi:Bax protein